jgi:DNA-binding response OmpR family regulator
VPTNPPRVQVVVDEVSTEVADAVRSIGFAVCVAPNVADAMSQYFEARPVAVVLDLGWRAEDAFEYSRQLRRLRRSEGLRIVGLLADQLKDCEPLAFEAGIDVCLAKPATSSELASELQKALGQI